MTETRCGGRVLPVGKIVCVGRNYGDHAREMGAATPLEPVLFLKPSTALSQGAAAIVLPRFSREVHHEVELVVRLGRGGRDLDREAASAAADAYGVGLDLTARDVQEAAKKAGLPWAVAKGFDGAAPLSELRPLRDLSGISDLTLSLEVNGVLRQHASTREMLFDVATLVAFASTRFRWEPGDLLFTGTPAGVGPLRPGDTLRARLGADLELALSVGSSG